MAETIIGTHKLVEALKAEGFPVPDRCREARLVMGVNQAFVMQFDVYVSGENLAKLGRAFERLAKDDQDS